MQDFWHCLNRACGVVLAAPDEREETRVCVCGSPMQKRERPAVYSYLNFLREEENAQSRMGARKEPIS